MRRRLLFLFLAGALVAGAAVAVAAAAGGKRAAPRAAAAAATVSVRRVKLGRILVDRSGRTLYLFEKDRHGRSACSGACARGWPPLMTHGRPRAKGGAHARLLGTTRRRSGTQVTYAGHPLYRFAGDSRPGQTNGEGSKAFGAAWYVVAPNGRKIDRD
jgi:predicted lipoprotein with Yx(FWY)xxD motif